MKKRTGEMENPSGTRDDDGQSKPAGSISDALIKESEDGTIRSLFEPLG